MRSPHPPTIRRPWRLAAITLVCLLAAPLAARATEAADSQAEGGSEEASPPGNRLRWSTASEVDNFGCHIYRSLSEDGPFERITAEPIPGQGTTDEPSFYEYVDEAIDLRRDYFYYVESVSMSGQRERFTPVIKAKAKQPPEDPAAGEDGGGDDDPQGRP